MKRLYNAVCGVLEAKAHMYQQEASQPARESDIAPSMVETTEGHHDNSLRVGFNRSEEDAFNDPMEKQ